jgi:F-type H+-transporting ATPase subunit a
MNIEIAAEKIFSLFGFPVTNALLLTWIVGAILIFISWVVSRKVTMVPTKIQNFFEYGFELLLGTMEKIYHSREQAEKFFPIIATIFIFVLTSNWLGIVPGVGSIGYKEVHEGHEVLIPFFRSGASDLNFTIALALTTVVLVNIIGIRALGFKVHLSKYLNFSNPIKFFVGILEFIGEIAKVISFSFRLFGNVFAGEVLLIIVGVLAPYIIPVPFLILEIFVGFVQALVFTMLTMVFIGIAVSHHE